MEESTFTWTKTCSVVDVPTKLTMCTVSSKMWCMETSHQSHRYGVPYNVVTESRVSSMHVATETVSATLQPGYTVMRIYKILKMPVLVGVCLLLAMAASKDCSSVYALLQETNL
jgi:hypothetical protein